MVYGGPFQGGAHDYKVRNTQHFELNPFVFAGGG